MTEGMHSRPFTGESDIWHIRQFLVDTYAITPLGLNWEVRRWDGLMFYCEQPGIPQAFGQRIYIWEDPQQGVLGVVVPEGSSAFHLFVHPDHRDLEPGMLAWAEEQFENTGDEPVKLATFAYKYDEYRSELLRSLEYTPSNAIGINRRMHLARTPAPVVEIPQPYTLSTTRRGDEGDGRRLAELLNAAFSRDFHVAKEFVTFSSYAPSYYQDLDLVAVARDGNYACYVGVAYDEVNRLGIFEPVCTHPDHRRKGLARQLMLEGIRRLKAMEAEAVVVSTGAMEPANRLYDSLRFDETQTGTDWTKQLHK